MLSVVLGVAVIAPTGAATKVAVKVAANSRLRAPAKDCRFIVVSPGQKIRACLVADPKAKTSKTLKKVVTSKSNKKAAVTTALPIPVDTAPLPLTPGPSAAAATVPPPTSTALAPATTIAPSTTAPSPSPAGPVVTQPGVVATALPSIAAVTVAPTTPVPATTTTTIPTPFPAAAGPATRATTATLDPYRGLGTWADVFDWTVQFSGIPKPKFTVATLDGVAAAGVQTLYLQVSKWDSKSGDIPEAARLQPIIDRAHQLGMFVVAWYLPTLEDVNADLRRTVAAANLDVDGISIDIETSRVKDLGVRNQRIVDYSAALRTLLPGRLITGTVLPPVDTDSPTYKLWPKLPYTSIAPYYDGWVIMGYWTAWKPESGWRDGYRYTQENIARLRSYLGRPDAPIHFAGGVGGSALKAWDVGGMVKAVQEAGVLGASVYDWLVTDPSYWQYLWGVRNVADPRFVAVLAPPVPPPTTTTVATTVPGGTAAPTTAPVGPDTGGNANITVIATVPLGQ